MKIDSDRSEFHPESLAALTLGEFAYRVIGKQYRSVIKCEKKVLKDENPENLHQMRVGTRRLRTALQVFGGVVTLPKVAQAKAIGTIARTLGTLRDLDVQIADLEQHYRPQLPGKEQAALDRVIQSLRLQRRDAFAQTEALLTQSRYRNLKEAYDRWFEQPVYTPLAELSLDAVLPDLLSPLLATLLLHPGWLIPTHDRSLASSHTLHDLRKACKHVRYQAEFFVDLYDVAFRDWIDEVKTIQGNLGKLQDSHVLLELLESQLPKGAKLPALQSAIDQAQEEALKDWEPTRQHYLDARYRQQLHYLLLEPQVSRSEAAVPEISHAH